MDKPVRDSNLDLEGPILPDEKDARHLDTDERRAPPVPQIPIYSQVEPASELDLSIGAILKGTAAKPLTNFEKKAALINAELDKFSLGRYQLCMWFLCGFCYFLDSAWAQGVGLITSAVFQEMNVPDDQTGTIWACANAGLAVGALTFGILINVIGRRRAFNLTSLICSVFGLLLVCATRDVLKDHADLKRLLPKRLLRTLRSLLPGLPCPRR